MFKIWAPGKAARISGARGALEAAGLAAVLQERLDPEHIRHVQAPEIARNVSALGERIRNENGTERAVAEIERYFA